MKMIVDKAYDGSFTGAEYRSKEMYGYGLYEISMKPIKNNGVVGRVKANEENQYGGSQDAERFPEAAGERKVVWHFK